MFTIINSKKIESRYCCAHSCEQPPVKKKGGLCHKHYARKRRIVDPVAQRYTQFKGNAKKRNIEFGLTLKEFRQFCQDTGYIITKYKRGRNCTIDRKNNNFGYYTYNIQLKSSIYNSRKGNRWNDPIDIEYCPF